MRVRDKRLTVREKGNDRRIGVRMYGSMPPQLLSCSLRVLPSLRHSRPLSHPNQIFYPRVIKERKRQINLTSFTRCMCPQIFCPLSHCLSPATFLSSPPLSSPNIFPLSLLNNACNDETAEKNSSSEETKADIMSPYKLWHRTCSAHSLLPFLMRQVRHIRLIPSFTIHLVVY